MQFANLFRISYWFVQPDPARGWLLWLLVGFFLVLVIAGIGMKIFRLYYMQERTSKEVARRASNLTSVMGLFGLLWVFFRQEVTPLFAWRLWLLVWVLGLAWWSAAVARYALKRVPQIRQEQMERERKEKYLP